MGRVIKFIAIFLLIPGVCYGATISRENIKVDTSYVSDGNTFFMVNFICEEENTSLPNVVNNTFIRCNIKNCLLDNGNIRMRSVYLPEKIVEVEHDTYEELEARVSQLEKYIINKDLVLPEKEK